MVKNTYDTIFESNEDNEKCPWLQPRAAVWGPVHCPPLAATSGCQLPAFPSNPSFVSLNFFSLSILSMSKSLALYAFEALACEFNQALLGGLHEFEKATRSKTGEYPAEAPLFVTWNKSNQLRGCIGTFLPLPTQQGIAQYALISAFEDSRFPPVRVSELPRMSVSITLLDNFISISDPTDWKIGLHGLKVLFTDRGRRYLGTFLPSVAEEQEWDQVDTLWNLLRKAGFSRVSIDDTLDYYTSAIKTDAMSLVRYDGLKCGATYQEYVDFKEHERV